MTPSTYIGRFAPSPTGPLHAGSLQAAMASYLDAKAHGGQWLVRIEDIDETRTVSGADQQILETLRQLGMVWDGEVVYQSRRKKLYQHAFEQLKSHTYACGCTRREIADSRSSIAGDGAVVYPGTCRNGVLPGRSGRSWRLRVPDAGQDREIIYFTDAWLGPVQSHLATESGDFVLKRTDGFWAYQLAVVVDDADQQVSHVVRGSDLVDSTARQIYLQGLLGLPTPQYLHVPVVVNEFGEKLSKQTGAPALSIDNPLTPLSEAARCLGLEILGSTNLDTFWRAAVVAWSQLRNTQGKASSSMIHNARPLMQ